MTCGTVCIATAAVNSGCDPNMPRYAEWSAAQHFPVALSPDKQKARASSLARLKLGTDRAAVLSLVGAPDYVGDGSLEPNAIACMWIYSFSDESPTTPPAKKSVVMLGFTADGKLAMLVPNKITGIPILQLADKSCEAKRMSPDSELAKDLASGETYTATGEKQRQIRTGYRRLSLGMTIDEVESLMGIPDLIHITSRGHIGSAVYVNEPCKRQLEYVLRQSSDNPIDPATSAIYLTFDDQGRFFWEYPRTSRD